MSQANVIPDSIILTFDVRLPPTTDLAVWEERLQGWLQEAGQGIELNWLQVWKGQGQGQGQEVTPFSCRR